MAGHSRSKNGVLSHAYVSRLSRVIGHGLVLLSEIAGTSPAMTIESAHIASHKVMAGHSRSKNGLLSHAYVPAIPLRRAVPS